VVRLILYSVALGCSVGYNKHCRQEQRLHNAPQNEKEERVGERVEAILVLKGTLPKGPAGDQQA
jgi:hypothetical protein